MGGADLEAGAVQAAEPAVAPAGAEREAGSLPFPDRPAGSDDPDLDFDHIVVVMMENHSFDNLLGDLGRSTNPKIKGLDFNSAGEATNSNPAGPGLPDVRSIRLTDTTQAKDITQSYKATAEQMHGTAMDGFVASEHGKDEAMGYYPPSVLPFSYSLAQTYTVADQWFCSTPGPTYPNRRFLLAGTAFGGTTSSPVEIWDALVKPPPNGSIFDVLSEHGISWASYSRDIPMTLVLPRVLIEHHGNHHRYPKFLEDCAAGTLPSVSFVDPKMGVLSAIGNSIDLIPAPVKAVLERLDPGETDEDPDDMFYGERWAHEVVEAVVRGPAWERTLLIYIFDEHGGYYDHEPPPAAPAPDSIQPKEAAGNYVRYGPRVPAVVVSPYSRAGGVSSTLYDHTSILATIEQRWNLPALTKRDANANTVADMLDFTQEPRRNPPELLAPSSSGASGPVSLSAVPASGAQPSKPPQGGVRMRDRLKTAAKDPVERYKELLGAAASTTGPLKTSALETVVRAGGNEVAALSRHVAEHSSLSVDQATPVVKAAIEKTTAEGKTDPKSKAEAVSKATAGLTGGSASVELTDPVMLDPLYRAIFGGAMALLFGACVGLIGSEAAATESAVICLSVLGALSLIAVLVLVMGYKSVKISGAGPSAGSGGS